jgi:hypothetical protein
VALERSASRSPLISQIVRQGAIHSHALGIDSAFYAKLSGKEKSSTAPSAVAPSARWMTPEFNYLIRPLAIIQLRCFFGAGESNLNKYTLAANSFVSDIAQRAKFKFIFHALDFFP